MPHERLYSDKEISRVLKRAAELQNTEGTTVRSGLTKAELQHAAEEVGIDPQWIQVAIRELEHGGGDEQDEAFHFWGAPLAVEVERIVQGEIQVDDWSDLVVEIRKATGKVGGLDQVGRHLEWRDPGTSDGVPIQFIALPRDGQTRLTLTASYKNVIPALPLIPLLLACTPPIIMANTGVPFWVNVALTGAVILGSAMVGRWGAKRYFQSQQRKLKNVMKRLVELTETLLQEQADQEAPPLLDLEDGVQPPAAERLPPRHRTR
ncbi:MAG: hypothetical protein AAGI71_12710 [Bacteroidota bacterium]